MSTPEKRQIFAKKLRALRKSKGLTQKEVGTLVGVTDAAVGMWEQAKRLPDPETMAHLAEIFGVSVDYLIGHSSEYIIREEENEYQVTPPPDEGDRERKERLRRVLEDPTITDLLMKVPDLTEEEKQSLAEHWAYVMDFIERKRQERKKQQND
jgi:transcriptional regulator with XRE-family HTH domain